MHISEGILSGPVLLSGAALTVMGTAVGLKQLDYDRIARTGILSAAFFVASLIHFHKIFFSKYKRSAHNDRAEKNT